MKGDCCRDNFNNRMIILYSDDLRDQRRSSGRFYSFMDLGISTREIPLKVDYLGLYLSPSKGTQLTRSTLGSLVLASQIRSAIKITPSMMATIKQAIPELELSAMSNFRNCGWERTMIPIQIYITMNLHRREYQRMLHIYSIEDNRWHNLWLGKQHTH